MPVITDWPEFFNAGSLERWQALNCSRTLQPRFEREVIAMHEFAIAEGLIEPRLAYAVCPVTEIGVDQINFENGQKLDDAAPVVKKFKNAKQLILALGTIGDGLDKTVAELFKEKKAIKALALEEVAVTAMFEFTNFVLSHIDEIATDRGLQASSPIYPGHDDFDISQQRVIHDLAGGEDIAMKVLETGMLYPAKSASMVFGLGKHMPRWDRKEDCETCKARERCRFRSADQLKNSNEVAA